MVNSFIRWSLAAALAIACVPIAVAAGGLRSPDIAPGGTWGLAGLEQDTHYRCPLHGDVFGMVHVTADGPAKVTVQVLRGEFSPGVAVLAPGGAVEWVNADNQTHAIQFLDSSALVSETHTSIHVWVISALGLSAAASVFLLVFAFRAYRKSRDANMAFVAGAFTLFLLKGALVAYSLHVSLIQHEVLELVDAIGDLGTVFLLVIPIVWPRR